MSYSEHPSTRNVERIIEMVDRELNKARKEADEANDTQEICVAAGKVEALSLINTGITRILCKTLREVVEVMSENEDSFLNFLNKVGPKKEEDIEIPIPNKTDDDIPFPDNDSDDIPL